MISDYAVIIAIFVFAMVDNAFHLRTPKLIVPTVFKVNFLSHHNSILKDFEMNFKRCLLSQTFPCISSRRGPTSERVGL